MVGRDTITYILQTEKGEYYCGKTINFQKRMSEHYKYQGWFKFNKRHDFKILITIKGDFEMNIKRFGVKNFINCLNSRQDTEVSRPW